MVIKNKKIISLALTCLFAVQIIFPAFVFISIENVKQLQQEIISSDKNTVKNSVRFEVDKNEFKKISNSFEKEFENNGVWYDVTECKKENGKYIVYAISDEKETRLIKLNAEDINKNQPASSRSLKIFFFLFLFQENVTTPTIFVKNILTCFSQITNCAINNPFIKIASPPPDTF